MSRLEFSFFTLVIMGQLALSSAFSQSRITGRIVDADTKQPLSDANVFLTNTNFGTSTNLAGYFELKELPSGYYELIVQYMGYAHVVQPVTLFKVDSLEYSITLQPKPVPLAEVVVEAPRDKEWRKRLKEFTKAFLGETKNAKKCRILNPQVINFGKRRHEGFDVFTAFSDSIVYVENRALGYRLDVVLHLFAWFETWAAHRVYSKFSELPPENATEKGLWIDNRRRCYEGSLRHFFYTIATGDSDREHFLAERFIREYSGMRFSDLDKMENEEWRPVDIAEQFRLEKDERTGLLRFSFDDVLRIWYKRYAKSRMQLTGQEALLDSLGNCYNAVAFNITGYWGQLRIADRLPEEYLAAELSR